MLSYFDYFFGYKTKPSSPEPGEWIVEHFHLLYLITTAPGSYASWFTCLSSEDDFHYYFNFSKRVLGALTEMDFKKFRKEYEEANSEMRSELLTKIKSNGGFIPGCLFDVLGEQLYKFAERYHLLEKLADIHDADGESVAPEKLFHLTGGLKDAFKEDLREFIKANPEFRQDLSAVPYKQQLNVNSHP